MSDEEAAYLAGHSGHDYEALMRRWSALIEPCCLAESTLFDGGYYPVKSYRTRKKPTAENGLYLCAGVHGDEPAPVWALLEWAEGNVDFLRNSAAVILPCFNPAGLVANTRADEFGRDLNRSFQERELPLFRTWHALMDGLRFRLALHLHEDYEALGIYLYELSVPEIDGGEAAMRACEAIIPRDPRTEIDDVPFRNGVMRRTEGVRRIVDEELGGGYPEAIYVFLHHAACAYTFETPSEFSLWRRVRAHRRFLEASIAAALT